MDSVTFFKICEMLLVLFYAASADYLMTSVLEPKFVFKKKIPFFNIQRITYTVILWVSFFFMSSENTSVLSVAKMLAQLALIVFMYKGKFVIKLLMYALHVLMLFVGEFMSMNLINALGFSMQEIVENKFNLGMFVCDFMASLVVLLAAYITHRIKDFPTKSLSAAQVQKLAALPVASAAIIIFFCLLEYGLAAPGLFTGCVALMLISALAVGITFQLDIFSEMFQTQQNARTAADSAQRARFELEKVRETVRHGDDVRRLEHDMKNLLLMIHMLNEQGDGARIDAMLDTIEANIKTETDSSIEQFGRTECIPVEKFSAYISNVDSNGSGAGKKSVESGKGSGTEASA